jgi:hypothetical protein
MPPVPRRHTREQLIHLLTEAAELEHNILCSYLYAAFSLKSGVEEGLSQHEAEAVAQWGRVILTVAVEEMGHLAIVNNLLVAVGGAPHFNRPNLPVAEGLPAVLLHGPAHTPYRGDPGSLHLPGASRGSPDRGP